MSSRRIAGVVAVYAIAIAILTIAPRPWRPVESTARPLIPALPMGPPMDMNRGHESVPHESRPSPKPLTPTEQRARIWDGPDVLETIRWAQKNGSPDEKSWAGELFNSCYLFAMPDSKAPEGDGSDKHKEQVSAFQKLERRCAGLKSLSHSQWQESLRDLRAGADEATTQYHTVRALYKRDDDRWTTAETQAVTDALHGDDPLSRKWPFFALLQGIDKKAPGGDVRYDALYFAKNLEIINPPLSEFEQLSECVLLPNCEFPTGGEPPRIDERLRSAYVAAFAEHLPAQEILSIR